MTSPFGPFQNPQQPAITPKTTQGGGAALPPYLQMRQPTGGPSGPQPSYPAQATQPIVTPKSTAVPGEVASKPASNVPGGGQWGPGGPQGYTNRVGIPAASGQAPQAQGLPQGPAQAGGQTLGDVYNFFKSDLENQRNQALASTKADASARGVFYGTPLTGSEADINTQYLRGLGQLQSGMYGNEQQNQLARLGLASSLGWQSAMTQPPMPGPIDFSGLGAVFAGQPGQQQQPNITPRTGPVNNQRGNQTQSGGGAGYTGFKGFGY